MHLEAGPSSIRLRHVIFIEGVRATRVWLLRRVADLLLGVAEVGTVTLIVLHGTMAASCFHVGLALTGLHHG